MRGFLGALYARRLVRGVEHRLCNISSWAVDHEHRKLSLSMIQGLLDQKDHTFTCFSPSDKVVEILGFFKFRKLETEKVIVTPLSGGRRLLGPARRWRVCQGAGTEARLDPMQLRLYRDHAGYRLGHFLIEDGTRSCYVVTGRRGRGPRIFADVLHVDDPGMLLECLPRLAWPLFRVHGTLLVGLDRRYVPRLPALSYVYGGLRPVQFRSATLEAKDIDALYTELVPMSG